MPEFSVRSATYMGADGILRGLSEKEWAEKRKQWEALLQKRRVKNLLGIERVK